MAEVCDRAPNKGDGPLFRNTFSAVRGEAILRHVTATKWRTKRRLEMDRAGQAEPFA